MSPGSATGSPRLPEKIISVVIPARNAASSIATLLRSLLPDFGLIHEIVLVDDGSEDATAQIAHMVAHRHNLPLEVLKVSCGNAGAARNIGMARARARFLFLVDGDDELVPGALTILAQILIKNPTAELVIGACIRRTAARPDKVKRPHGYTDDCRQNVVRYLANDLWPIAMGSALLATSAIADIRFPEAIGLDEDTCFWATLLARIRVVTCADPVIIYKHDEHRMARRFITSPRRTLLAVARTFRSLALYDVPEFAWKQRIAWVALRIARQLIIHRRYSEAGSILRLARRHPDFKASWKIFRYDCRIKMGSFLQRFGICKSLAVHGKIDDENGRRRILMVTLDDASTPVSGADLRNYQNARAAANLGPIRIISIRPGTQIIADHDAGMEFFSVGIPGEKSKSLSSRRCSVEARIPRACLPRLLKIIQDFKPETIVVEGIPLAALLKHLRPLAKLLILDMHNLESDLASAQSPHNSVWKKISNIIRRDVARIRKLERNAVQIVDRIWVCSEPDRDRFIKLHQPFRPIYIVPNGIPRLDAHVPEVESRFCQEASGPVMLFVGHLGYWPNVAAVERLVRGVFPRVKAVFPSAKVVLAGRYPNAVVKAFAAWPGVELHANPENLAGFYEQAHMAVVPLSAGGGTRIKILEAMVLKLPVIATPVAVEGLGLIENEEILLAVSDEGIADHIIHLRRQPGRMLRQILLAEETVKLRFGSVMINSAIKSGTSLNL